MSSPNFPYSDKEIEALLNGVYTGEIDPIDLPEGLYYECAGYLEKAVLVGFEIPDAAFANIESATDLELLTAMRENIYMFSAAKNFQMVLEMSQSLHDEDGKRLSPGEFKKQAREIYLKHYGGEGENKEFKEGWVQAEYDTANACGYSAKQWTRAEQQKDLFPYLTYIATEDALVCSICGPLNGITLPINNPFWDSNMPPTHFSCRCMTQQVNKEEGESKHTPDDKVESAVTSSQEKKNPLFNFNPGNDQFVFKSSGEDKHPYFIVEPKYREFKNDNFGLDLPGK